MKSTLLWTLVVLNVVLLITFVNQVTAPNAAVAQAARRPAEYLMLPGEVMGGTNAVIYMIDTSNGLLGALAYDETRRPAKLEAMPPIDLNGLFEAGVGGVGKNDRKPK